MKSTYKRIAQKGVPTFAFILLLSLAACPADDQTGDFVWYKDGNGGIIITGYTGQGGEVVIPEQINGNPVRAIGERAFQGKHLSSVIIPHSVTSIEHSAFAMNQLTSVTIPDSVITIRHFAFAMNQLTSVTISDNVTSIWINAFADNLLTSITIGANVDISQDVFNNGFEIVYEDNGRMAGAYTRPDTDSMDWTK